MAHDPSNEYVSDDPVIYSVRQPLVDGNEHYMEIHLASVAEKKRLWWKNAVINSFFIASWFIFATFLSVYNKWMFSPDRYGFSYPLLVTTLHVLVQFVLASIIRAVWPRRFRPEINPTMSDLGYSLFALPLTDLPFRKKVAPTAVTTALDIGLSNVSLKVITLSFYTMCKSSSLVFVLLFAFLFRLETFSLRLVGVIALIFCGVLLMVATETHFVLSGFMLVLSASALGGLRWTLTQLLLKSKNIGLDNPAATMFWLAPAMGLTLAIISAMVDDWVAIFQSEYFANMSTGLNTAALLTIPGVVAFFMVLSEFYILQRAGVVPMSIAGIAKEVATISVSAWFFGDQLTPLNITGVVIAISGIGLFTYHKYRKSIEATVSVDADGNPANDEFDSPRSLLNSLELSETQRLNPGIPCVNEDFRLDESGTDNFQLIFSTEEAGEEDADDIQSIRSSKVRWSSGHSVPTTNGIPLVRERDDAPDRFED